MTANHAYTPDTQHVRGGYSIKPPGHSVLSARERYAAEFDRWLATVEAAAEQRGKEQAWDEGYRDGYSDGLSDGHSLDNMRDPNENPYRADLLEGDDE